MTADPQELRTLALSVLNSGCRLTRKSGQFLGQLVAEPLPLTDLQADWLDKLLSKAMEAGRG